MKHLFSFALAVLLAASCSTPANRFTLNGTIDGLEGETIVLTLGHGRVDSTVISDGKFSFTDTISHSQPVVLVVGEMSYNNMNHLAQFFIDPIEMNITVPADNFSGFSLTGSPSQDEVTALDAETNALKDKANEIHSLKRTTTDPAVLDSLEKISEDISKQFTAAYCNFIKEHPASWVAASYMRYISGSVSYEELKGLFDGFTEEIKKSKELEEIRTELQALENVMPGKPAPNIAKKDINGNDFDMSSLKGNVILLDFWASWCGPCRRSNPHVKALYDKYHEKGFEVVMVSDDDSNEDAWRKAVADDQTGAFHHVLRGLKRNPEGSAEPYDSSEDVSDAYAIHYLPTKYLIDKDFNVIGKLTDEELDAKLKEIFGF